MATKKSPRAAFRRILNMPVFSQPQPTSDPQTFKIKHPSNADDYRAIDTLRRTTASPLTWPSVC